MAVMSRSGVRGYQAGSREREGTRALERRAEGGVFSEPRKARERPLGRVLGGVRCGGGSL